MKKFWIYLIILFSSWVGFTQEEVVHSVYFEFDKYEVKDDQKDKVVLFAKAIDSTKVESISILGYCDDRGKDEYNFKLSNNRANTIKDILINEGIKNKIIVSIEGKGRVLIEDDMIENLPEARSKNRRVDVVVNFKEIEEEPIIVPGTYDVFTKDRVVGDRIRIRNIQFDRGSSKITKNSIKELNKVVAFLQKNKTVHLEIQGHVCCTPTYHKEAIDIDTRKRELSTNRAKAVYKYLISKKIAPNRLTYKGYGTNFPLGKNPQQDKRVEFVITKK